MPPDARCAAASSAAMAEEALGREALGQGQQEVLVACAPCLEDAAAWPLLAEDGILQPTASCEWRQVLLKGRAE